MAGGSGSAYADYTRRLVRGAVGLVRLSGHARALDDLEEAAQLDATLHRLETGFFQVAVVGEFKRGKSSFVNALLGAPVLPTDAMPATATVSRVIWGREPAAELVLLDGGRQRVPIPELAEHITQITPQAARRAALVKEAVVSFPTLFCRDNVQLIDTPGLNDSAAMTRLTREILPEADAAILVLSALQPFAQTETAFLEELLGYIEPERLFVVVNMLDQVQEVDAPRVLDHVEERLRGTVAKVVGEARALPPERLFGVSAWAALEALCRNDHNGFAHSHFHAFYDALRHYLRRDRFDAALQPALQAVGRGVTALQARLDARRDQELDALAGELAALRQEGEALAAHSAAVAALEAALEERLVEARSQFAATVPVELTDLQKEITELVGALPIGPGELDNLTALDARVTGALKALATRRFAAFRMLRATDLVDFAAYEIGQLEAVGQQLAAIMGRRRAGGALPTLDHRDLLPTEDALADLARKLEAGFAPGYGFGGGLGVYSAHAARTLVRWFGNPDSPEARAAEARRRQEAIRSLRQNYMSSSEEAAASLFRTLDVGGALSKVFDDAAAPLRRLWAERAPQIAALIEARQIEIQVETARLEARSQHVRERFDAQMRELAEIGEAARSGRDEVVAHLSGRGALPAAA